MTLYEHVFIVRPEISPQRANKLAEEFAAIAAQNGGSVDKTEFWGLRELAYPIKKNEKGYYFLLNIKTDNAQLSEMERQMKLHDDVLRYLSLKVSALDPNPSVQMQNKEKDEGWNSDDKNSNDKNSNDNRNLSEVPPISNNEIEVRDE